MYKILLIDDDADTLSAISTCFPWSDMGLQLIGTENNGTEGLMSIIQYRPDIVIIDIRMPGMDGLSVIQKSIDQGVESFFIIISAYGDFEYAQTALRLSVCEFLLKPFSPYDLEEALRKVIKKKDCRVTERILLQYGFPLSGSDALYYPVEEERKIVESLHSGRKDNLEVFLDRFLCGAFANNSIDDAHACVSRLYSAIITPLIEHDILLPINRIDGIRWETKGSQKSLRQLMMVLANDALDALHYNSAINPTVVSAQKYIHAHYKNKLTLGKVASAVHISPSYLSNLFSKSLRMSFVCYVNKIRVEYAKKLLQSTDTNLSHVADNVGFNDVKYFSQVFKQCTGCSPNHYRNHMIKKHKQEVTTTTQDQTS